MRQERTGKTLTTVRDLGFDSRMVVGGVSSETVFFLGTALQSGQEQGEHATEAAILEFIAHHKHQINVATEYLMNGRENRTDKWRKSSLEEIEAYHEACLTAQRLLQTDRPGNALPSWRSPD